MTKSLMKLGVKEGDTVIVGDVCFNDLILPFVLCFILSDTISLAVKNVLQFVQNTHLQTPAMASLKQTYNLL